jgi:hypothetical protein
MVSAVTAACAILKPMRADTRQFWPAMEPILKKVLLCPMAFDVIAG